MSEIKTLINAFVIALEVPIEQVNETLQYNDNPKWDSTAHMILIAELENAFDIMLDIDDIIDMSSFTKAIEILKKYNPALTF